MHAEDSTVASASIPRQFVSIAAVPAPVRLNSRTIVTFRASVLKATPAFRATATVQRIDALLDEAQSDSVGIEWVDGGAILVIDQRQAVLITTQDVDPDLDGDFRTVALKARSVLQTIVSEERERRSLPHLLRAIGMMLAATALFAVLFLIVRWLRRVLTTRLTGSVTRRVDENRTIREILGDANFLRIALSRIINLTSWGIVAVAAYSWLTFSLRQFPFTRAWGEGMSSSILGLLDWILEGVLEAVPGLTIVLVIFLLARLVVKLVIGILHRVEHGSLTLTFIDPDTVRPTRRIITVVIWLFAFAFAFPYIPGSDSEAFRGVSVLAGLMLSLGASNTIGQALSGFILMYTRTIRVGEYVTIGASSGTVTRIGFFSTRLRTAYMEEVALPNTTVVGSTVVNHTRLSERSIAYSTSVTIGYDTPWRLVHDMLLEAARRTSLIASDPAPYVTQTSLQDFYVEYRLTVLLSDPTQRRQTISDLHGAIQDVFNENGVQIMSPHYVGDPNQDKIVDPTQANPPLRRPQ